MIRIILLAVFFGNLISCQSDRERFAEDTTIEGEFVYNFGDAVQGEVVKARFEIKNTGDVPLKLFEVKPSCGCTLADYEKSAVDPGKSAWVEAEVETKDFGGVISKKVTVMANTKPTATVLTITGNVLVKN